MYKYFLLELIRFWFLFTVSLFFSFILLSFYLFWNPFCWRFFHMNFFSKSSYFVSIFRLCFFFFMFQSNMLFGYQFMLLYIGVFLLYDWYVHLTRSNPFESYSNGHKMWCKIILLFVVFIWELRHNFQVSDPICRLKCHQASRVH